MPREATIDTNNTQILLPDISCGALHYQAESYSKYLADKNFRTTPVSRPYNPNDTTFETSQQEDIFEARTVECLEFCKSHDIKDTLKECFSTIKEEFGSSLKKIKAELDCFYDDEEESEPHVAIEITVNSSRQIAEANYDQWLDWFVKDVPDSVRKFFVLTIDRE